MQNTTNYNLNKPSKNDKVDIDILNQNMDIIDAEIQRLDDKIDEGNNDTHSHNNKTILDGITSTLINDWNTAKRHADSVHAPTDATKVEASDTNGNIVINGTEVNVYTHPNGTNPHGMTKNDIGLENVNNTSDIDKPVSTAQQSAIDEALVQSNYYTDTKIADLINGAPENLDTLKEVSDAIAENKTIMDALNASIGTKAKQAELDTHTSNNVIHVTQSDKDNWNDTNDKKHIHDNKTVLDNISSTIIAAWDSAVTHISDAIKHITSDERSSWNTAKSHADSIHARIDATKVEASDINGNIKINGIETTVYTDPNDSTSNDLTKDDIGLGNVPNVTTNDQTPTYTESKDLSKLVSGEKLSVAFGKISKAISDLISHISDKQNPHEVTKEQLGLSNVENKDSITIRSELTNNDVVTALGYTPPTSDEVSLSISDATNNIVSTIDDINTEINIIKESLQEETNNERAFILTNQQELSFTDNICEIIDDRITSYSIADVYFTSDTISIAEKSIITVETYDGKLELTATNAPEDIIKATIRVEVIN